LYIKPVSAAEQTRILRRSDTAQTGYVLHNSPSKRLSTSRSYVHILLRRRRHERTTNSNIRKMSSVRYLKRHEK